MKKLYIRFLLFCMFFLPFACHDDIGVYTDANSLAFSSDTLSFDTVFTTIGSTTAKLMVYNTSKKAVNIDMIKLAGGSSSPFRINVDGAKNSNHQFKDIGMRAKDSLFVFVELHINPNDNNLPVLVQDSIVFNIDGKWNRVLLEAHGQDIEILRGLTILNDTALTAEKPYLVYDSLMVYPNATLSLPAGTKIYYHKDANLVVYGNLLVDGSFDQPVVMRGDRLDKIDYDHPIPYQYVAGQWGGVYLLSPTGQHIIKHLDISSGEVGIYFYNEDKNSNPSLEIHNSKIHNFLVYNLVAINGDLLVANSELSNSGSYTVYLNGGHHAFYHCTIANLFNNSSGRPINRDNTPAVMMMDLNKQLPMETVFKNCVITGTAQTEFAIASKFIDLYKGDFSHNYIKRPKDTILAVYQNIRWDEYRDTLFVRSRYDNKEDTYFDFTPDSVSPLRGLADIDISLLYPIDLHGRSRLEDGEPDAGAYEWYPTIAQ